MLWSDRSEKGSREHRSTKQTQAKGNGQAPAFTMPNVSKQWASGTAKASYGSGRAITSRFNVNDGIFSLPVGEVTQRADAMNIKALAISTKVQKNHYRTSWCALRELFLKKRG